LYFVLEKGVSEQLLTNPDEKVEGTVKELAEKYVKSCSYTPFSKRKYLCQNLCNSPLSAFSL